jgi:hypothetical protein
VRADHERSGVAFGKSFRVDEDTIIRRAIIMREIDDRPGTGSLCGDRDELCRGRLAAGGVFHAVDVVDHREVGSLGIVRNRDPDRRKGRVVGKADMKIGVPGDRRDLQRIRADRKTGTGAGKELDAGQQRGRDQGNRRDQKLQTQHDTHSLKAPAWAYGWQSVKKTRYRKVDVIQIASTA